jgi:hypothetical protein
MHQRGREWPAAERQRRPNEVAPPDLEGGAAGDAGEHRDIEDADGDDGVHRPRPEQGGDQDRRQDGGKGEGEIDEPADQFVGPAAQRRRQQAERHAHRHAQPHRHRADRDRVARPDHDHGQDVAAEMIGA